MEAALAERIGRPKPTKDEIEALTNGSALMGDLINASQLGL
jgi:hypothetical protein